MINHFLGDAVGVLSCRFWSIVLQSGARLPIHTLNYWTEQSLCRFLAGGVFECNITHRRSVAVLCMLYKIRRNPVHPLNGALPGPYVPVRVTRALWSHICILMHRLAAEPWSTAGLLFPSRCASGTILLTLHSMVWDWRLARAGPLLLYWSKLLYPYYSLLLFSLSLLSVYRLVLWGWGLRTDRVYFTLSQPCTADLF